MAIHDAIIAVDFDGTVVTHAYPYVGEDAGAVPVLRELVDNGCKLILYTMRSDKLLEAARALSGVDATAPVQAGDVLLPDVCGTGVDVVATRSILS